MALLLDEMRMSIEGRAYVENIGEHLLPRGVIALVCSADIRGARLHLQCQHGRQVMDDFHFRVG